MVCVVRQAARVEPRCDGFCSSGIAQGMRSCLFFLSSVCSRTDQGVSGSVGDRESVVEALCQVDHLGVRYAADRRADSNPRMVQSQAQWIAREQQR